MTLGKHFLPARSRVRLTVTRWGPIYGRICGYDLMTLVTCLYLVIILVVRFTKDY